MLSILVKERIQGYKQRKFYLFLIFGRFLISLSVKLDKYLIVKSHIEIISC